MQHASYGTSRRKRWRRSLNVHRTHLGALERGRREPHLTMLLILADALDADNLLAGLPVPRERKPPTHWKGGP